MVLNEIVFRICQLVGQLLEVCLIGQVLQSSISHQPVMSRMSLNWTCVPVSFCNSWIHEDASCFGLIKELPADL